MKLGLSNGLVIERFDRMTSFCFLLWVQSCVLFPKQLDPLLSRRDALNRILVASVGGNYKVMGFGNNVWLFIK